MQTTPLRCNIVEILAALVAIGRHSWVISDIFEDPGVSI